MLGGSVSSFFAKADYYFADRLHNADGRAISSWYWRHSLDAALRLECSIDDREFAFVQVSIPVVSNTSRPEYSPSGDYNYDENNWKIKVFGGTTWIPKDFAADVLVVYDRPFVGIVNLTFSYEFSYATYERPRELGIFVNALRAGVHFCF
jgi:hypothetical protein